ncbi:MAG TPA: DNA recombination protein RmuC [Candidatus Dormibacteraeota bacterium]|nr:DNA recombination protein RmuC [Candidatus Dormibacteraeota bacterium]
MNPWIILSVVVGAAGGLAIWAIANQGRTQRRAELLESQLTALRQEMQSLHAMQAQNFASQIGQLNQTVTHQLGQMNQTVQKGVDNSILLTSKGQENWNAEVKSSREVLGKIQMQLGEVQQASMGLSLASQALQTVLTGAKTRGGLGEVTLERLLADTLPVSSYQTQYHFSTGDVVDAIVRLRDKLLPIDSKFPLEDYRRVVTEGDEARRGFLQAVRTHADSICKKYILPDEGTLDIALMFVPSEGVYYELLMSADSKGIALDEYCRGKSVIPVSPNTLYAHLRLIMMGLHGMQIEENATKLGEGLAGLKKQFENFGELYDKLGTHLRNAQQSYLDADRKLDRARATLDQMAEGALPEAAAKPLELSAKGHLSLEPDAR